MPTLIRMSEATALGLHAATYIATQPGRKVPVSEMTRVCRASADHLNKVCQKLTRAGILRGRRGQGGGLSLALPAAKIRLARIYELFEGPIGDPNCVLKRAPCQGTGDGRCVFSLDLAPLHARIEAYFRGTSLADMAKRCHRAGQTVRP